MSSQVFEKLNEHVAESLLMREIKAAEQQRDRVLKRHDGLDRALTEEERAAVSRDFRLHTERVGQLITELGRLWDHGDWSGLQQRLRNGEAQLEVAPKKTYVVEIDGEAIMAFRVVDEEEANNLQDERASEELSEEDEEVEGYGGIRHELLLYDRADGRPVWDGHSKLCVRPATETEHEIWQRNRDASIGRGMDGGIDVGDDLDDWNVFLIPISDPLANDDDEQPPEIEKGEER